MKKMLFLACTVLSLSITLAQAPSIVKSVGGTTAEPFSTDQEGWKSNEWNGFFFYQGKGSPTKLSVTDGTNPGTKYLADVGSGTIVATIPARDFMYIITSRIASFSPILYEYQVWRSDATAAGTTLVYTMPQSSISNACLFTSDRDSKRNFSVIDNDMYFGGYDAVNGNELWVTNGTAAGTHIVKDIKPGTGNSLPMAFCKIGTTIYFSAMQTGFERKLWKTDGTDAGTVQIAVAEPFFIQDNVVGLVNNKMIFYAHNTVDGFEPYVSDGTAAGTFMLKNINPAGNSTLSSVQNAHLRFNSKYCFFVAFNGVANALWRTDGTSSGTIQLTADAQNAFSGVSGGGYTDADENGLWMIEYNAAGSGSNEKLYRTDGTVAGTYLVASGLSFAQYLKIYKNGLWMASRNTGSVANVEPWRSGGNAPTTNRAFEIAPGTAGSPTFTPISSNPFGYFIKNGKLYFFASSNAAPDRNLYQYTEDFTFNGTQTGGRWRDSANWNGLMPPGILDTAYLYAGTPNPMNIEGANAYTGTFIMGNNTNVTLVTSTDSLIVNSALRAGTNNNFSGNGAVLFRSIISDTVDISGALEINNASVQSTASLESGLISILNNLDLSRDAQLLLNENNVQLTGSSSTISRSGNSYINTNGSGKLMISSIGTGGRTGAVLFPVGSSLHYNPATLTNSGALDDFSMRVAPFISMSYTGENGNGNYTGKAVANTWFISDVTPGGSNVDLALQWNQSQELTGFDRSQSYLGHFTGGSWNLGPVGAATGTNPYTYSRTGITSFSPFGILNNNAVLPLSFINFSAQRCNTNFVCLAWRIATPQRVASYVIERSLDGVHYSTVASIVSQQMQQQYAATDDITTVSSSKIYYRIKQVNDDGSSFYSPIAIIHSKEDNILVYPTVFNQSFTVQHNDNSRLVLHLYTMDGKVVLVQQLNKGINLVHPSNLSPGMYIYSIVDEKGDIRVKGKAVSIWK